MLLKTRVAIFSGQQIQKGIEHKHIKLWSNKIYIHNKLHREVIDSHFVPFQSQQPTAVMDTSSNTDRSSNTVREPISATFCWYTNPQQNN